MVRFPSANGLVKKAQHHWGCPCAGSKNAEYLLFHFKNPEILTEKNSDISPALTRCIESVALTEDTEPSPSRVSGPVHQSMSHGVSLSWCAGHAKVCMRLSCPLSTPD